MPPVEGEKYVSLVWQAAFSVPNQIAERMGNTIQMQNLTKKILRRLRLNMMGGCTWFLSKAAEKKVLNGRMRSVVEKELFSF